MLPGQDWPRLAPARVHEFCGGARRTLAALAMGAGAGPVIWIFPGWQAERLMPDGLSRLTDPGRIVFVAARRPEDLLWSMEEALRSGAAPLVVAELTAPPGLTPVRRLHLAAEAGSAARRAPEPPTGLILTPEAGGAAGVESRWRMEAAAHGGWRLSLLRARMTPPGDWSVMPGRGRITLERIAAEAPRSALPDPCGSP
jgi:protein ImuA